MIFVKTRVQIFVLQGIKMYIVIVRKEWRIEIRMYDIWLCNESSTLPVSTRNMLFGMHSAKSSNWSWAHPVNKELKSRWRRLFVTWNNAKWINWRTNLGRPNQKYLSEPCTRGIPWTTACLSVISRAILVNIAWSFVPTAKIICEKANSQGFFATSAVKQTHDREKN